MPSAVVTGARGFLGRHVARRLAQEGWEVAGLGHGDWPDAAQWGVARWLEADVSFEAMAALQITPQLIVHCAGTSTVSGCDVMPLSAFGRTVDATYRVLEFQRRKCPAALLVLASSAAVYGHAKRLPTDESQAMAPLSLYGHFKAQAERACEFYATHFALDTVMLRFFSLYGPQLRKQLIWDASGKIMSGRGNFAGTGEEVRDWLHVHDAAALVATIAQRRPDFSGSIAINGGGGAGVSNRSLLEVLSRALGRSPDIQFDGRPRAGDPPVFVAETSRARALGWAPQIGLEKGLEEFARWYISEAGCGDR